MWNRLPNALNTKTVFVSMKFVVPQLRMSARGVRAAEGAKCVCSPLARKLVLMI